MESAEIQALTEAVSAVCPIDGVSSTGRVDFKESATQEQRDAAVAVVKGFVYVPAAPEPSRSELKAQLDAQGAELAAIKAMLANLAKLASTP